jgi:hypothetical protein
LNSRPQPYQGCALPLSYGSTFAEEAAPMGDRQSCQPALAAKALAGQCKSMSKQDKSREERLAKALRDNLRRRKAQARELKDDGTKPISDDSESPSRR